MSILNRKPGWAALVAVSAVLVAGSYTIGGRHINPFHVISLSAAPNDSTEIATSLYQRCGSLSGDAKINCYSKPLDSLASRGLVRVAMVALAHIGVLDIDVRRDGHVFAHGIGIAAGKSRSDVGKAFAMCDESNQSGCYHGVIQAYFATAKNIGPTEVNSLCELFRGPTADRWLRFQCVHGMGHGLEMIYGHNLIKALASCDDLADPWDRTSCYGGAFMENIVNVTMPKHPSHALAEHGGMQMAGMEASPFKAIDPADPLYPCSIVEARYVGACYQMQTSVILYLNHGNIGAAAKTCDTAPEPMRYTCYQSLGRDISSYALQDHAKAIQMCSLGTPKYQPWCFVGLVKNFVDINARASEGLSLCKELTGETNKVKCYEAVGEQIGTLRNEAEARRALCQPSEPDYLDVCLRSAGIDAVTPKLLQKLNTRSAGD
jgi:hypothetical protein